MEQPPDVAAGLDGEGRGGKAWLQPLFLKTGKGEGLIDPMESHKVLDVRHFPHYHIEGNL